MADVVLAKLGMDYFKIAIVKGMELEEARSYYKKRNGISFRESVTITLIKMMD